MLPSADQNPAFEILPEILAPAGGRAQFFAALHAGADAVYLGLKEFNARGRAENFTIQDLEELAPIARRFGMKILVTLNILLKEAELPRLLEDLLALQWVGIHAVIVQDLGVARFIRSHFPHIRLHASTQLAVHNAAGVRAAHAFGFKRVVLARELTAQELRRIVLAVPEVEIEAFCHGSLCYSYSGLCFFSGAEDARSGNRGECAYTCRKPYKIVSEAGHGFLFSMKDLNTSKDLPRLLKSGIHTLKIEGRKKDAQYVSTAVGLYRSELNKLFGRETGPQGRSIARDYAHDMSFSFHREMTTFFVNGRYHENVIDLNNPTHKGLPIGTIEKIQGRQIEIMSQAALERFDGIRIDSRRAVYHAKPQHGESLASTPQQAQKRYENDACQFSLRDFAIRGRRVTECAAHTRVTIEVPSDVPMPAIGDAVFKIRSNELKRHTESLTHAPQDVRLRALKWIDLSLSIKQDGDDAVLSAHASLGSHPILTQEMRTPWQEPLRSSSLAKDLAESFTLFGDCGVETELKIVYERLPFIQRSLLKEFKALISNALPGAIAATQQRIKTTALAGLATERSAWQRNGASTYSLKIDRLEYLDAITEFLGTAPAFALKELVFEPKRAFLGKLSGSEVFAQLLAFARQHACQLRLALPTVIRAWDEPLLKVWIREFIAASGTAFEVGNLGALDMLREWGVTDADISADFTLYTMNTEAALAARELGVSKIALSIEDDRHSIEDKLSSWPRTGPSVQAILYKDTPLFIAEACSLTALHHGCPGSSVCGYRTLEIENDAGERFFVAHESCKSIVYAARPYAIVHQQAQLEAMGVHDFRIDLLTRPYSGEQLIAILRSCGKQEKIQAGHSANFEGHLL